MEISTWNILTCAHCGQLVKLPKTVGSARALCPGCKAPLPTATATDDPTPRVVTRSAAPPPPPVVVAPVKLPETPPEPTALPTVRSFNPDAPRVRTDRESWEHKAPELREIDFKDRLARTTDPDMVQGPDAPPPLKRRRISRSDQRQREMGWEEGAARPAGTTWPAWKRALLKLPWGLITLGILAFTALTHKIIEVRDRNKPAQNAYTPAAPTIQKPKLSELELRPKASLLHDITPVLKTFLDAKTSVEMKAVVREPERVLPLLDAYYQEQEKFQPVDYHAMPRFDSLFVHKDFVVVTLENKQFEPFTVSMEKTPDGFRVDWESFVAYGDMSVANFIKTKPTKPTLMRFIAEPFSYPNLDFPSNETHQAYKLYDRTRSTMIYGYAVRRSPVHEKFTAALLKKQSTYCVLRVKYPEHSTNDQQVEITHYLQTGWVLRGEDYETPDSSSAPGVLGE